MQRNGGIAMAANTSLANASSGGVGRLKIAEGGTVLPQSRVFMRYNHFAGAQAGQRDQLNRFTPGFEWAFGSGLLSLEVRAPFATDAHTTSVLRADGLSNGSKTRFGNLSLYGKALLYSNDTLAVSGGLGLSLPTADDIQVRLADGTELLEVENQAVHLQPFLGALYTPNDRWFAQGFLQQDTAVSGNRVSLNWDGNGLRRVGTLDDPNHLFFDLGLGYWLYRSSSARGLTGVVPMVELHHAAALGKGNLVGQGAIEVGNSRGTQSQTSALAGTTFEFGQTSQLTVGYAAPLGGGSDRQYNGALQVMLNRAL